MKFPFLVFLIFLPALCWAEHPTQSGSRAYSIFTQPTTKRPGDGPMTPCCPEEVAAIKRILDASEIVKSNPDIQITTSGSGLKVSFNTREWTVYVRDGRGFWLDTPRKDVGPDNDGVIISVGFFPINHVESLAMRYYAINLDGLDIPKTDTRFLKPGDRAAFPPVIEYPYWDTYLCGAYFRDFGFKVHINISFNGHTDRAFMTAMLTAIRNAIERERDMKPRKTEQGAAAKP